MADLVADLVADLRAARPAAAEREIHDAVHSHDAPAARRVRALLGLRTAPRR